MNNVVKKLSALLIILIILFMSKISSVYASTTFTTCTLSEGSYIRNEPGGTPLKDVDGNNFLIYSPKRLEVIDSKYVSGREYKKIRTNYYSNNYEGWIYSRYLKDFKTYTTDDNYGNSLRSAGFPESYILPLQKLHAMYPNWNFIPSKLGGGLDFNTVIAQEYSPVYKNLINSKDQSLYSTDGAAYNSGKFTEFEPGWYAPSKQTIAFYMDPRNWLMDNTIFMFEQLSYNSSLHTEAAVQKVLDGTFMQGSYDYNGTKISYAKTFVEAGKLRNVSPVQLASRVVQEQGVNGNSLTINMKSDGKTYYNFFNINAYGSSNEAIVSNALNTAKENGWDNPYSSIIGGSSTISNGYNNVGQDTIYYQKFNTINSKNLYWNQYMANVRVLPTEANSSYSSYVKSGLVNSSFTFKIPVYNNMPDKTTLSITGNDDNTLKSLSVSGCNLNPSFNSAATDYTCNVSSTLKQVTISASKTSAYSVMKGDGVVILNDKTTIANIEVTAANGNVRTYKITIQKVESGKESPADIISYLGYNNSNGILSGIALDTDVTNIISNVRNKFASSNINIKDKNGSVKENGKISTGDKITITSNSSTITYKVAVKGDVNGDGKISISDYAKVKSHILGVARVDNEYLKAADANGDGKVSIADYAKIKSHILGTSKITK